MNSVIRKGAVISVVLGLLLSACGSNLWGTYDLYVTPTPTPTFNPTPTSISTFAGTEPDPTSTDILLPVSTTQTAVILPSPTDTPTLAAGTPGTQRPLIYYSSQSGDSLVAVAQHFGVLVSDISSTETLSTAGLLNPGTPLVIPNRLSQTPTTPSKQIIPDSELVFSPSAQSFDIIGYVTSMGGYLSTFHEPRGNVVITGAEGVRLMAFGSSISPRILLALIQYYTGWVQGQPVPGVDSDFPLRYQDPLFKGLYQQLRLIVRELLAGYYGWRDGTLTTLTFPDGMALRLAPTLNAGTVALQYLFSRHLNYADWLPVVDPKTGFPSLFTSMFGDPWERSQETGPLFPPDLAQPPFILPFDVGVPWTFTSGPHPAWEEQSALAALDFAPPQEASTCESQAWVVAVATGQIVRSEGSYVVLDLDGDGFEQTGWVVLYQHIATNDRIAAGTWVTAGEHIGHASCEGGLATGANVHIARKYNGEWVSAGDPLPFVLSGWTAHAGSQMRKGTLTKGNKMITASPVSLGESQIIRKPGE